VRPVRAAFVLLMAAVAGWMVGLVGFAGAIPDQVQDDGRQTDAIVVLTGGTGRIEEGLALLSQGRAKKLFISGVPREVELSQFAAKGLSPELAACCVALGHEADSTRQNAEETARWMRAEGFRSLRLVTAAYHMPRSRIEFHAALADAEIVPHPVFPEHVKQHDWWRRPGTASLIISEYTKTLAVEASLWLRRIAKRV
jgi:uncharacterized SAM-binding protein YcdF (DUF218 family)